MVRLAELLRRSDETTVTTPDQVYRELTIRLWGKGVVLRKGAPGASFSAQRRFVAHTGQFVLSRIDARNGALGVVPADLDGAVVSNDFPLFGLDRSRLMPEFLGWMSRSAAFVEQCQRASEGTTNRVRLQEGRFLKIEIPLPPLEEQRRIVGEMETVACATTEATALHLDAKAETSALMTSARRRFIGDAIDTSWISLNDLVARIESGKSPQCESRPAIGDEWGVLKVGSVSLGVFLEHENKALPLGVAPNTILEVKPGDFLMSRANTTQLVGACAIVGHTRTRLLLSDKTFRMHLRRAQETHAGWLCHVMKSPALREQIERAASGTSSTMKNISKEKVLQLRLPQHSPEHQRRVAACLDEIEGRASAAAALHGAAAGGTIALQSAFLQRSLT